MDSGLHCPDCPYLAFPEIPMKEGNGPHRRCRNGFLLLGVEGDEHRMSWLWAWVSERHPLTGFGCHSWGMVAGPTVPEGDGSEIHSSLWEPIWKETPVWGMDILGPYLLLHSQVQLPECFPPNGGSSEAWGGTGTGGLGSFSGTWHWPLLSPSPSHSLTNNNGWCEKTDLGPWCFRVRGSVYDQGQGSDRYRRGLYPRPASGLSQQLEWKLCLTMFWAQSGSRIKFSLSVWLRVRTRSVTEIRAQSATRERREAKLCFCFPTGPCGCGCVGMRVYGAVFVLPQPRAQSPGLTSRQASQLFSHLFYEFSCWSSYTSFERTS